MKALSVRQPYAELIALGEKTIEVRSWRTDYRGPLVICAGAAWHPVGARMFGKFGERGVAVCVVELVDVRPFVIDDAEAAKVYDAAGDVERELLAWVLRDPQRVAPAPVRGALSLFVVPDESISR